MTEITKMPTKHIDDKTWKKVNDTTIKAIIQTKEHFKESEILKLLINIGATKITADDIEKEAKIKREGGS